MKRVLIVDDRPENLYLLSVLLTGHGYEVAEARHGAEALTLARQSLPQLIISDLLMPVMDGYTLLRHWKLDERLKGIPFIVYTATYTEPKDERLALDLGADAFILKPAEPDAFMAQVEEVLARYARGELAAPHAPTANEKGQLKEYSETLIRKLETKMIELEHANRALEQDIAQRKRTEEALRETESRLRLSITASNIGLWDWNLITNEVYFSPEWKGQLGYADAEIPNCLEVWQSRLHPDDMAPTLAKVRRFIDDPAADYTVEFRLRHKDGSYRWIFTQARIFRDAGGKPVRMVGCHIDITERKQAEALAIGQKQVLEMIASGATLPDTLAVLVQLIEVQAPGMLGSILLLDGDGVRVRNGASPSLPEEYVAAIDGEPIGPCAGSCGTAAYRKEPVFVEDIATDPLWVKYKAAALPHGLRACWSTPILDEQRRVLGTFAMYYRRPALPQPEHRRLIEIATHIAAIAIGNHQTEAALRESEARLREVLDGLGPHVFVGLMDLQGVVLLANRPALAAAGLQPEAVQGRPVADTYWWSFSAAVQARIRDAVARAARGEPVRYDEQIRVAEGQLIWLDFSIEPVCDEAGNVRYLVPSGRVITDRKNAESILIARTDELRALAGRLQVIREEERTAIAREIHDVLAQELTRLKIDIAWINKRIAAPPDESIRDQILDKLKDLSAQTDTAIRTVQRIATELRPVVLDSLGLAAAIEWQIEDFEKRTDIRCRVAVPAHDPPLNRDQATACFRILQESLTNVVRHAQATKVDVKLCEEDGQLLLTIRDNGRGIEPEKLHDPHSIGLVGMRERALSFGGILEFTGMPGEGVTVTLRIPLLAPA